MTWRELYDKMRINGNDLNVYLKLFVLLYADDTVVFATSEETFIQSLNLFSNYCNHWKLDINFDKTKVLAFGDRINRQRHIWIENHIIELLNEFKYLGFIFNKKRKFSSMKKDVVNQARKSLFGLYTKIRSLDLSIACQLKLFDNLAVPILTYGCVI